jgi:hypothetical protein
MSLPTAVRLGTCTFELTGAYRVIKIRKSKIFVSYALFFRRLSQERALLVHSGGSYSGAICVFSHRHCSQSLTTLSACADMVRRMNALPYLITQGEFL